MVSTWVYEQTMTRHDYKRKCATKEFSNKIYTHVVTIQTVWKLCFKSDAGNA